MKEDGRKLRKEQQAEARRRAMLLLKKGWQERDIAEAVGVHERTVRQWKQHQRDHGTAALLSDERGRKHGQKRTLTAAQEKEVQKLISDKLPEQLKLPFALWTRKAGGRSAGAALWDQAAGAHHGRVSPALGVHAAEAAHQGL